MLKTILLIALPASGKSEVRRYLDTLTTETLRHDMHLGETVQFDDFPYVHIMRVIDQTLLPTLGKRLFFTADNGTFIDKRDWGTLIHMLNQDHDDVVHQHSRSTEHAAAALLQRLEKASHLAKLPARLDMLDNDARHGLADVLEPAAQQIVETHQARLEQGLENKTLLIEFARGGPSGSTMPLPEPHGYHYAMSHLSDAILQHARIMYVHVTPQQSRQKNLERADPKEPGSILHHSVPEQVMRTEYGCDDIGWLTTHSRQRNTIHIHTHNRDYDLPIAEFDNRTDKTSFVRQPTEQWQPTETDTLHHALASAFSSLANH